MKNVLIILFLYVVFAFGQLQWAQRARVKDHTKFYSEVIQETIYELERRGFSSLTLLNITHNVNLQIYNFLVNGTVNYTNGFLVSIQKIDVTGIGQSVNTLTIDGVPTARATVSGTLNFREAKLGYDVTFHAVNGEVHKYTGEYTHTLISWPISIQQNITTKEITVSTWLGSLSGGLHTMVYRPANSTTEVISREFSPHHNLAGVRTWENVIVPIILDVIKNKVPFPVICYNYC
ncbi:hypothetical protein PYW08_007830 [Mythimna loreyi]|uniref:Uncharacterized protein n=1 Tax=Mythimna loreyi TaxID=667449 RepID=A0ACC2QDZ4_9NEOP|nr:hypothetical protein PYW08_007830 [Mythimna loreyi]